MGRRPRRKRSSTVTGIISVLILMGVFSGIFSGWWKFLVIAALGIVIYNILKPYIQEWKERAQSPTIGWTAEEARRAAAQDARNSYQAGSRSQSAETPFTAARSDRINVSTPSPAQPPVREAPSSAETAAPARKKPEYPPEVQKVVEQGEEARRELSRLYATIPDIAVKRKVQELMDISGKIIDDAREDPTDVPQIQKFLDYYLPTTIKLLKNYERMSSQGISGENITKSMDNIKEMLDTTIDAYKKLLDSLFANQALDIETDIQVMNTLLKREGLAGGSAFQTGSSPFQTGGSAFQTERK